MELMKYEETSVKYIVINIFFVTQKQNSGLGRRIFEVSRSHTNAW
jgi:hypothetical protein